MGEIILRIPDGKKCDGCMFLNIDFMKDIPQCNLFNCVLDFRKNWGDVDRDSITKCDRCPKGN